MAESEDPEQQYSLRWNDFHASILSSFRHLRDEEDFVDVTLACEGCSFTAHKVVLSACSPYFRKLLKANPCQHPIVILRDVKEKDMESLLRFMYNGEVHIGQEQLSDFLKTAQMLQVRGLADVPTKESHKSSTLSTSNSLPWCQSSEQRESFNDDVPSPPAKRSRNNEHHRFSPSPTSSVNNCNNNINNNNSSNNHNNTASNPVSSEVRDSLLGQVLEGASSLHNTVNSSQVKGNSDSSLHAQSTGDESNSSDTAPSDQGGPILDHMIRPKSEPNDYGGIEDSPHHGNGSIVGLDTPRTPSFPASLLGLPGIPGLLPGPSGMHNNNQDANFVSRRGLDMLRVRATDPRPCPKCGKIYRSAHTLRTHLEDKHTICPGYRCVLCGTVAKSRNSLHSHMSRQHRGISTKDLPVLPMPSPFDPDLASRLLAKAGVKVSAAELRARASPTGPRRPDLRLEVRSNHDGDDPEDLTVPNSRFSPPPHNSTAVITRIPTGPMMAPKSVTSPLGHRMPERPPPGASTGSAILDTYLQFIAENSSSLGLGLSPEQAVAAAKAAAMGSNMKLQLPSDEGGESSGGEDDEYSDEEQEAIRAE